MILDHLKNADTYIGCHPKLDLIFRYLQENAEQLKKAETGKQGLPEYMEGITMKIVEFDTVEGTRKWESHIENAFLYYMLEGSERCGYSDISRMHGGVRTHGKDQIVWQGDGDRVLFAQDNFLILFPQDAHMSKLADGTPARARKCSFKFRFKETEEETNQ